MLTTIPVLALALSVEAVRQVRTSIGLGWKTRALQTLLFGGYGLALIISFYISVDALAHRDGFERATLVGSMLSASLLVLVGTPLGDIVVRNNPEIRTVVIRSMPWSSWRRHRRKFRKGMKDTQELADEIRSHIRVQNEVLRQGEERLATARKARDWVAAMRSFHDAIPVDIAGNSWDQVESAVAEAEVDQLQPGTLIGRAEFHVEVVRTAMRDTEAMLERVERLQRRELVAFRTIRLFRFSRQERSSFQYQLEALRKEFENLPTS